MRNTQRNKAKRERICLKGTATSLAGFSVVELVVVFAIVALLVGLLLPAVLAAREGSRRAKCGSNLKQIALAGHNFNSVHQLLPANGWGFAWLGDGNLGVGPTQPGGWIFQVLPYMERESLFNQSVGKIGSNFESSQCQLASSPVEVFLCPSRPGVGVGPHTTMFAYRNAPSCTMDARTDYAVNEGDFISGTGAGPVSVTEAQSSSYVWTDITRTTGVSWLRGSVGLENVPDGTSFTYFSGEKCVSADSYFTGTDFGYDQSLFSGVDLDISRWTLHPPLSDRSALPDKNRRFGSIHGDSFRMAMCDGSVRVVSYAIHPDIHRGNGNRGDGFQ